MSLKRYDNNRILVWSDPHFPYSHRHWYDFLYQIKKDYEPDRVICGGDLLDLYSVSSYPKDMSHPDSWTEELKKARKEISKAVKLFPNMEVMSSNHDDRAIKKSVVAGIPRELMAPYHDVIGAPKTWRFHKRLRIRSEKYKKCWEFAHTLDGGSFNASKALGCSVAIGHHHPRFSMQAFNNGDQVVYGVDVGCLISDEGSAFKYNKTQLGRPIRGACMIIDGIPVLIPMRG